jgi:hypothetical protein
MKYRIKPFDLMNDIWLLQKRVMWIFWQTLGCGTKSEVQKKADELNAAERPGSGTPGQRL